MNPEEAVALLRQHALALIEMATKVGKLDPYEQNPEVLMTWCMDLLNALAESKWATADIIERLTSAEGIELIRNQIPPRPQPLMIGSIYSEPPFDKGFFLKHKDI